MPPFFEDLGQSEILSEIKPKDFFSNLILKYVLYRVQGKNFIHKKTDQIYTFQGKFSDLHNSWPNKTKQEST